MSKAITMNGKRYTSTTVRGIAQRIGTASAKRDADITELASVCALQAASGNLNYFNDVLVPMDGFLHKVTGLPTVEGRSILAYLKAVYPAVEYDDDKRAFAFKEGVNREKYATGEAREKKGKIQKVKATFDAEFAGFPLTYGAFKSEWIDASKADKGGPRPITVKSATSRLDKLAKAFEEQGLKVEEKADVEALRKAAEDLYARMTAAILKAEDSIEQHEQGAAEMLENVTSSAEKRADTDRDSHQQQTMAV